MKAWSDAVAVQLKKITWAPPLLARLSVGWVLAESGWGKFHNLAAVAEYFQELGIPAASLQAPFVAGVELVGGALLIVGAFTRISSGLLIATMVVAITTAKRGEIESLSDLFGMSEYLMAALLFWLAANGPGEVSLDQKLTKRP